MKMVLLALLLLGISSGALAQSDVSLSFDIIGGLQLTDGSYEEMDLDINFETSTLSVHGTLITSDGLSSPATGTCFFTSSGGAYCNLQVDHLSVTVSLESNLAGTISVKNSVGQVLDTAPVQVYRG